MRNLLLSLTIGINILLFSSCLAIFGIHKIKPVTENRILKQSAKFNIPKSDLYTLDSTFFSYLFSLPQKEYAKQIKNHYQPLQVLYFQKHDSLIKFYVNCYAGGIMKLKWNSYERLNVFPPKNQAPTDTILNLKKQLLFLKNTSCSTKENLNNDSSDFTVFIYWNIFMRRHSKRLIKEIRKNCSLINNGQTVRIVYVNNDNLFFAFKKQFE